VDDIISRLGARGLRVILDEHQDLQTAL